MTMEMERRLQCQTQLAQHLEGMADLMGQAERLHLVGGGVVHGAVRSQLDRAHAQRIVAITDEGDRGLIALNACQAYVREVTK